ncbi:MAG: transglutaminase domain-containing protein [Pyrinomonadaceae bacterium]
MSEIPSEFHSAISRIDLKGLQTFQKAKRIAFDLAYGHRPGKGLSSDSGRALKFIYAGNAGVCSDYAQVYTGLCLASGILIREWGLCDDFVATKYGHSFSEVFSSEYDKWVFIDAYRSVYATRQGRTEPMSVIELIDLVTAHLADRIHFRYIVDERRPAGRPVADVFCNSENIFFLLSDYNVFRQDKALKWANVLPLPLLHFILLITGEYQRFHVYINHDNERVMKEKLRALRRYFLSA